MATIVVPHQLANPARDRSQTLLGYTTRYTARYTAGYTAAALTLVAGVWLASALTRETPLGLAIREDNGQVLISWRTSAAANGATLEIVDGDERIALYIAPGLANITYLARGADVEVRMAKLEGPETEVARYLANEAASAGLVEAGISQTISSAQSLRAQIRGRERRIAALQADADRLLAGARPRPVANKSANPQPTRWWRD